MTSPPQFAIDAAVAEAKRSPCAKSKRGVVFFTYYPERVVSGGYNAQPVPFGCNGSAECRAACGKLSEHAEAAALRGIGLHVTSGDLLHVKVVDGELVPSGPPSCWQCSRAILADRRVNGMWLYHGDGWRRYKPDEFHRLTLAECGLPILETNED